ncbi:MAG TPA: hypothetical protein VIM42_06720 [Clostridium sp.]
MDILYVSNEKMRSSVMVEAIFNKRCIIDNINPRVINISLYSKKINGLKNNVFLLLDKIRKIVVFK